MIDVAEHHAYQLAKVHEVGPNDFCANYSRKCLLVSLRGIIKIKGSLYGYTPTRWICILFVVLFSLSTSIHAGQATFWRLWWLLPTIVAGGMSEIIGWIGRLWSSSRPGLLDPFLMQICCTIIAPSFITAANFVILGKIINALGSHYSRLSSRLYTIVFVTCDIVALVVQAIGGGRASIAAQNGDDPEKGAKIMVAGIIFQMVAISIYTLLAFEFLIRYHLDRPLRERHSATEHKAKFSTRLSLMVLGLFISTLFIYIRSIYRTIELLDGWTGPIITKQLYFNVLDGMPIVVAMYALNVFHPGYLLRNEDGTVVTREKGTGESLD